MTAPWQECGDELAEREQQMAKVCQRESARRAPAMQSRAIQIPVWWRCAILILPSLPLGSCHLRGVVRGCLLLEPTWSPCVFAFFLSPSRAMTQVRPARSVHTTRTRQRSVGGVHHLPGAPVVLPAPRTPPHRGKRPNRPGGRQPETLRATRAHRSGPLPRPG